MATLFAPFKVLALSVVVIILALTLLSSLVFWVEDESEVLYSSPGYSVVYKPSLLNTVAGSNETRVKVEVQDRAGRPLKFIAHLSGPTSQGAAEVGLIGGKGYAVESIGRYVAEVKRTLRELDSDPERSGLGMLILISAVIEEDGEKYAAADAVSVPIIPGRAVGKDIVVKVTFKPIMKYKISGENTSTRSGEEQSQTTPPPIIWDYCTEYGCFYWRLKETLYVSKERDYIPIAITVIEDPQLGKIARLAQTDLTIRLERGKVYYVKFGTSLGFQVGNSISVLALSEGFRYDIRRDLSIETIYRVNCYIRPKYSIDPSACIYLDYDPRYGYIDRKGYPDKFDGDVVFSVGFRGKIWLLRYEYVFDGAVIDDSYLAVWVAPYFKEGRVIEVAWEVVDNVYDSYSRTVKILEYLRADYEYKYIHKGEGVLSIPIWYIYDYSRTSPHLGLVMAVGATILASVAEFPPAIVAVAAVLASGINAGWETRELYNNFGSFTIDLTTESIIYGYYAEFDILYLIKGESERKVAPLMIFRPSRY